MFRRLQLEGFGRYAQPVEVRFHEGINVYIVPSIYSPNESGEFTLVAGIGAILYGLERSKKSESVSAGTFQCWYRHDGFKEKMGLVHDGKRWLIERDFSTK